MKFPTSGRFGGDLKGGKGMEAQGAAVWPRRFNRRSRGPPLVVIGFV